MIIINDFKLKFIAYFKANKIFIASLLSCAIITSLIMVLLNKGTKPSIIANADITIEDTTLKQFESYALELSTINTSLANCVDGLSINSKEAPTILNNNLLSLDKLKNNISSIVITNNSNPELIPKIISSIEKTEELYKYCVEVLTNNSYLNNAEITSEIFILKENCIESYNELNNYGLSVEFSDDSITFLDNLASYLNTLDRLTKEQSIKTSQFNDYMAKLTLTTNEFSPLLEDLEPAIIQIREDNRSLDIILDDIKSKEELLSTIKTDFTYSSIPEGCLSYYNTFNNVFKLYSTYLSTLKLAVIYEKSSPSYESNKESIDSNYENAFSKFTDVKLSFESLVNSIE